MTWNDTTRPQYERKSDRYASDLTDDEWRLIEPYMPPPSHVGHPRKWPLREILNAILYIASTGCQWEMLPKDFPPPSTVRYWFYKWRDDGLWQTINHHLVIKTREEKQGRSASPSAGVIDAQSVKTDENGGIRGYDAGKKVRERKRHIITDTTGLLVGAAIHAADIQDRDGAPDVLKSIRHSYPWLRHIFADGGYAGPKLKKALARMGDWTIEIIKRSDKAEGFEKLPRRWVVERTFAWLGRCRRLAKDCEKTVKSALAGLMIAHIRRVTRYLARP